MYCTWLRATANVDEMASSFSFVVERSNPIQSNQKKENFIFFCAQLQLLYGSQQMFIHAQWKKKEKEKEKKTADGCNNMEAALTISKA